MGDNIILRTVVRILVPFIFMYGLYVQLHGEYSPGGGFQAGVICASAFIVYSFIHGLGSILKVISVNLARNLCALGVLIYGSVGIAAMVKGGNFLGYSSLASDPVSGQKIGILIIELGVGLTVFSVIMLIFYMFAMRAQKDV